MKHEIGIWFDSVPPHTQPGTTSDYFLAVGIDSDVPKILVYIHAERTWTAGGGDTQRVRLWAHIPPLPNSVISVKNEERSDDRLQAEVRQ
jgi:hypothetical protein